MNLQHAAPQQPKAGEVPMDDEDAKMHVLVIGMGSSKLAIARAIFLTGVGMRSSLDRRNYTPYRNHLH